MILLLMLKLISYYEKVAKVVQILILVSRKFPHDILLRF